MRVSGYRRHPFCKPSQFVDEEWLGHRAADGEACRGRGAPQPAFARRRPWRKREISGQASGRLVQRKRSRAVRLVRPGILLDLAPTAIRSRCASSMPRGKASAAHLCGRRGRRTTVVLLLDFAVSACDAREHGVIGLQQRVWKTNNYRPVLGCLKLGRVG